MLKGMKKFFLTIFAFVLINILVSKNEIWACKINFGSVVQGVVPITITQWLNVGEQHSIIISRNDKIFASYSFTPSVATSEWSGRLPIVSGNNTISVPMVDNRGVECRDSVTAAEAGGGVSGDPLKNSPRGWLPQIVPDFGPPPSLGINFFKNNLAQFLISLLVFFTIVLSLIFTIIGGIMLSMAGGNKEGMGKAKATITYALVGLALGLGSLLILSVVGNFFKFSLTGS